MVRALHSSETLPALRSGSPSLLPPSAALINAHILNILLSAHSQSGLPAPHTANNRAGAEPLLGWKELGQTEDITPREERKEGGARLQKLGAKPTSVCWGSPGAVGVSARAPAVYAEGEWVWSVAVPREAPRWRGRRCFAFSLKTNWAFFARSADSPPLWVTSRKGRCRGVCLQPSEPPQHAHHPCPSSKRSRFFQLQALPFNVPAFQPRISS